MSLQYILYQLNNWGWASRSGVETWKKTQANKQRYYRLEDGKLELCMWQTN